MALAPTQNIIPSYLYVEYADDDNLQAFVAAYNALAQSYLTWFNTILLPVYTSPTITGLLLDWVGSGLYGMPRPVLPYGIGSVIGPPNTYTPNVLPPNVRRLISNPGFYATTDSIYKAILTWHFWKGDGKYFCIPWLKRRVARFLFGNNFDVGNLSLISITSSAGVFTITLTSVPTPSLALIFASGINSGALETPWQYTFNVVT